MKITIKNNWNDVKLIDLEAITLLNDVKIPDDLKMVEMLAILSDVSYDDIMKLSATDMMKLMNELTFLTTEVPKTVVKPSLEINGKKYNHILNPKEITAGQFLDYKILIQQKDIDKKIARLIACFTVPDGCNYGEGYDTEELVDLINENVSVVEGQSIVDFFMIQFYAFSEALATSSIKNLRKQMKKAKSYKEKRQIVTAINLLKEVKNSAKSFGHL